MRELPRARRTRPLRRLAGRELGRRVPWIEKRVGWYERRGRGEEIADGCLDLFRDVAAAELGADHASGLLEADPFRQAHGRGDLLRLGCGTGDADVELVVGVESRKRNAEDVLVEVAGSELAD